jgi:metal-responsive CopG/Arc/MetJ family transcriptional regulator
MYLTEADTRAKLIDPAKEIKCPIYKMLDEVELFFKRNTRLASKVVEFKRVDIPEYPYEAIRDLIRDSLVKEEWEDGGLETIGTITHEHSHYAEHDHEHLPKLVDIPEARVTVDMTDMDKLKRLLEHWIEHNRSHREDYEKWSERMEAITKEDQARILKDIAKETRSIDKLFLRLKEGL